MDVKISLLSLFVVWFIGVPFCIGATYSLKEEIVGNAFYSHFDWEAVEDPNHGRV